MNTPFKNDLLLQLKRMRHSFPRILAASLLILGTVLLLLSAFLFRSANDPADQKVSLGVVGNAEGSYLGFGIHALQKLDSSRSSLNLILYDREEEALTALHQSDIMGYLLLPENFTESIVTGENASVTFVVGASHADLASRLVMELADSVSTCITESQAGIYTMQTYWRSHDLEEQLPQDEQQLNLSYFDLILSRDKIFEVSEASASVGSSSAGYYLCAMLVFYFLILGTASAPVLIRKDLTCEKLLLSRGIGMLRQTLAAFTAYLLMILAVYLLLFSVILGALYLGYLITGTESLLFVPEILSFSDGLRFALKSLPVPICLTALSFLLYSFTSDPVTGMLLQFFAGVGLSFVSGCFYPIYFFPETFQRLSALLPTSQCLSCLNVLLQSGSWPSSVWAVLLWAILFVLLSAVVYRFRIRK